MSIASSTSTSTTSTVNASSNIRIFMNKTTKQENKKTTIDDKIDSTANFKYYDKISILIDHDFLASIFFKNRITTTKT